MEFLPTVGKEQQGSAIDPPAGSFRFELGNAAVKAIRQHGSEAFGILLIGIAYLLVTLPALALFLSICHLFDIDLVPASVTIVCALSSAVGLAMGRNICGRIFNPPITDVRECALAEDDPAAKANFAQIDLLRPAEPPGS